MNRNILSAVLIMTLATGFAAEDPKELLAAKKEFAAAPHPDEAARQHYITTLARLREKLAKSNGNWQAVDAELRHHPVPSDADSKALSSLRAGKWKSPRHDYLFRKDGTWTMLPAEPDATRGQWRIEGNRYHEEDRTYTLILLTNKDLIFTDGQVVFYETREGK